MIQRTAKRFGQWYAVYSVNVRLCCLLQDLRTWKHIFHSGSC